MRPPLPCLCNPVASACARFAAVLLLAAPSAWADPAAEPFRFRDVGDEAGVYPHVGGIRGHGVAFGDVDGNGWPDLFLTTFHNSGSKPGMLLRNDRGSFRLDPQELLRTSGIGSGALFADFTNNGRLDLYVSHCAHGKEGLTAVPSLLLRNEGDGTFVDVSRDSGACPPGYAGRGVAALDFDGDGLLDLATCEQYYSAKVPTGPRLLLNLGGHRFADVAEKAGLPVGLGGLAIAAADMNNDTWPDLFLVSGAGDHRLLLNDGKGSFLEAPGAREVFRWNLASGDDMPAGVCLADVNRDGRPDVLIGNHFKSPWTTPAPIRLYLNRGGPDGCPVFEDVTAASGVTALPMKAPHVEIQDLDNDGWPDLFVSVVKFKEGQPHPVIFRNLGAGKDGVPRFQADAWAVNDFPSEADRAIKRSGDFFDKMLREQKIMYMAAGPSVDFDRDGRLDFFLANWWLESRSLLLRNETKGGRWLSVRVQGGPGVNRQGVGARVRLYAAGKAGQPDARLATREIAIGYGYCSGQEAEAHFGLGAQDHVDVVVEWPAGKGTLTRANVHADQRLLVTP